AADDNGAMRLREGQRQRAVALQQTPDCAEGQHAESQRGNGNVVAPPQQPADRSGAQLCAEPMEDAPYATRSATHETGSSLRVPREVGASISAVRAWRKCR